MNFLKNLFGGGGSGSSNDRGLYFYVQPRGCEEVVQIRIDPVNDLSQREGGGYFVQKTVRGQHRCFNPAEITLYFNKSKEMESHDISAGTLVNKDAYDQWNADLAAKKEAARAQNAAIDAANQQDSNDDSDDTPTA